MLKMISSAIVNQKLEEKVISIIMDGLKDHFAGGLDERAIRETEAYVISREIGGKILQAIAELFCETPQER
jgi:hypothetical protein